MRSVAIFATALTLGLAVAPSCAPREERATLSNGDVTFEADLAPFRFRVRNARGEVVLASSSESTNAVFGAVAVTHEEPYYRSQIIPGWDTYDGQEDPWTNIGDAYVIARSSSSLTLYVPHDKAAVRIEVTVDGGRVRMVAQAVGESQAGQPLNHVSMSLASPRDEHFFGMGERFASVDHRGLSFYNWAEEGGLGKGEAAPRGPQNPGPNGPSMTYFPVPFFLSSKGYGARLHTEHRSQVHFASEREDVLRLEAHEDKLDVSFYVHDDPRASLDAFTRETARPVEPTPWAFGFMKKSGPSTQVDGVPEWLLHRQRHVPLTIIDNSTHFLPARSELGREQELREYADTLHQWGYKFLGYYNPYVSMTLPGGREDFEYGKANGLFLKDANGDVGRVFLISGGAQDVATIDLTAPAGVAWFQRLLGRALALGYDGWMHDFGEYVQHDWRAADGRSGAALHNAFPVLSAKAAHDLLTRVKPDDFLFYVRSGYVGSAEYAPAVWGGDSEATFDETQGLPSALRSGLNLGMSGVAMWGSDINGFKCITAAPNDKEVFFRWMQLGAVSPFMQEQNACSNPTGDKKEKWSGFRDDETVALYRRMTQLHTRLQPYFLALAKEAHERGIPMMRHPFLLAPRDPEVMGLEDAFFLGDGLYTAPVVRRGQTSREVYFPAGRYLDWESGRLFEGGRRAQVEAPLTKLPLFLVEGQLVPMLDPEVQSLAPSREPSVVTAETVADRLDVVGAIAPGGRARFVMSDGTQLEVAPATQGAAALTEARDAAVLAECDNCANVGPFGAATRVRVTTAKEQASELSHAGLRFSVRGPSARRVRWDIYVLPR
jgi:alpha-glucosidase (family GH31 glycosyl hydrolase)